MTRVAVQPQLLRWATLRAGLAAHDLEARFPKLPEWQRGDTLPTLKQLERFAKATRTPIGYLFLAEPPVETVPIPDFRTVGNAHIDRPSPDLLETVYICQQRQEWYRDYARSAGGRSLEFVGAATTRSDVVATAATIRAALGLDLNERGQIRTWTDALRRFIEQADALGVLVMVSGIVGSNTSRTLDPDEFRGFALADPLAPLVFINGADTKSAQMFTLAHELAHLWLGQTALSDASPAHAPTHAVERWCNQVAAELLVPLAVIGQDYRPQAELIDEMNRLARRFKVSTLVVLRRIYDLGGMPAELFRAAYAEELARLQTITGGSGGNFYLTTSARVSKRFARALITSTLEGQTLYRDAFRMLGIAKHATFREFARGVEAL